MSKKSIRFYKGHKVRAVWNEDGNHWWFSVLDIVGAINQQDDHEKNRNYWKYLKAKLKKENFFKLQRNKEKTYQIIYVLLHICNEAGHGRYGS